MKQLCNTDVVSVNQDIIFAKVDEDIVLLEPVSGQYYALNKTGAKLWILVENEPTTLSNMAQYLMKQYKITEKQALTDASAFLDYMLQQNFFSKN